MALYCNLIGNVGSLKNLTVFKVGDIWLPAKLLLLGGVVKFFKPKHKDKLKEANWIITIDFCGCEAHVLSWQICKDAARTLVCICVGSDDIHFSNKIGNNRIMAIEIEEERTHPSVNDDVNE